jgi:hypothetical protein
LGSCTLGSVPASGYDAIPGRVFEGTVESRSGGTGARFALVPPDNASGNFVKVVQRVPVRIAWKTPGGAARRRALRRCDCDRPLTSVDRPRPLSRAVPHPAPGSFSRPKHARRRGRRPLEVMGRASPEAIAGCGPEQCGTLSGGREAEGSSSAETESRYRPLGAGSPVPLRNCEVSVLGPARRSRLSVKGKMAALRPQPPRFRGRPIPPCQRVAWNAI